MHRDLAREAVRKSLVLLKNGKDPSKPFLPLSKSNGRLLVAGKHVNDLGYQCGGWTITKYGSSGQITDAIIAVKGDNMEVIFEANPTQSTFQTLKFTSAIVVVGEEPYAECGGDNQKLELTTDTIEMIEFVCSRVPTLLILISGRPLIVEPLLESVEAFVAAWLPGSEGGGVADVIFGDYEFHGCLPRTWLKRVDQLPMNVRTQIMILCFPLGLGSK
ncbi:hypothetical protein AMTR_s01723p00004890 [Amborella trichopoda]|uniref:Glycoside hydrolase family 3 C-terminal domain-containing protein n=1 Tax=Amborella trichopoda TaxID=13333 RepID=W1PXS2_AMBTC|nr:hypothetical protein AMTR_s01723p00004890 [Amborella trichopoda]